MQRQAQVILNFYFYLVKLAEKIFESKKNDFFKSIKTQLRLSTFLSQLLDFSTKVRRNR